MLREKGVHGGLVADLQRQFIVAAYIGLRIDRRLRGHGARRHQRHIIAAERAVDERLLAVAGAFQDVIAHESEGPADVEPRRRQVLRQRYGEGAVLAIAVLRGRAGLGGIGDQRIRARWLDLGKAAADRARRQRVLHVAREWIVAAGVEDHQAKLLGRLDRDQDAVQRKRLVVDVGVALELGVHRNQVVGAVDLHAMAGIIDHRDVGIARAVFEIAQHAPRVERRQIVAGDDDVEAGALERRRHHGSIIDRIRQRRHVLIGRIAEDQRHALVGQSGFGHQEQRRGQDQSMQDKSAQFEQSGPDHRDTPNFQHLGLFSRI